MKSEPAGQPKGRGAPGDQTLAAGLHPSDIEIYGWHVRDQPVSITMRKDVIENLHEDVVQGLTMSTPCDVTGLLIGRVVSESGSTIIVEGYELARYGGENGAPPFGRDQRLADMVKQWSKRKGPFQVVGFFRSQRRGWPAIDREDLKGAKRLLPGSKNIFLLIQSALDRDCTGLLFFRDAKSARVEEEYGEFSFNAALLRAHSETPPGKREAAQPRTQDRPRSETAKVIAIEAARSESAEPTAQPAPRLVQGLFARAMAAGQAAGWPGKTAARESVLQGPAKDEPVSSPENASVDGPADGLTSNEAATKRTTVLFEGLLAKAKTARDRLLAKETATSEPAEPMAKEAPTPTTSNQSAESVAAEVTEALPDEAAASIAENAVSEKPKPTEFLAGLLAKAKTALDKLLAKETATSEPARPVAEEAPTPTTSNQSAESFATDTHEAPLGEAVCEKPMEVIAKEAAANEPAEPMAKEALPSAAPKQSAESVAAEVTEALPDEAAASIAENAVSEKPKPTEFLAGLLAKAKTALDKLLAKETATHESPEPIAEETLSQTAPNQSAESLAEEGIVTDDVTAEETGTNEPAADSVSHEHTKQTGWDEPARPSSKDWARNEPIGLFAAPAAASERADSSMKEPEARDESPEAEDEDATLRELAAWLAENPPPPTSRPSSWLSIAATWMIAVGITVWYMDGRSLFSHKRPDVRPTRAVVITNPLSLQVDRGGALLDIVWDRTSPTAMNSRGGFLTIRDGNSIKQVRLDSSEIRTGHLYYGPTSADLGIRLEVAAEDGETTSESVRVVGPPAPPTRTRR